MVFQESEYHPYDFANRRHIGPSPSEIAAMLRAVGAASLEALIDETVPAGIRQAEPLSFGPALSEQAALHRLRLTANRNRVLTSLIGQGYHGTVTPPVIQRNILENPAWYTAYTPYQPEISQGRLEALLNFQTMVCDLTGLDVANACLLDEATAAAEAMALCQRAATSKAAAFFVDRDCHPQTIDVIRTRAEPYGWEVVVGRPLRRSRCGGGVRGDLPVSGDPRGLPGLLRADRGAAWSGGAGVRGGGSAGADAADAAGRDGGGHRGGLDAAVRGAAGVRRAACGLYGGEGCA